MATKTNIVNLAARISKLIPKKDWNSVSDGYLEFEKKFFTFIRTTFSEEERLELLFQIFYKGDLSPEVIKKNVEGVRFIVFLENSGRRGYDNCDECESGVNQCDVCYGSGEIDCDYCGGTGTETCDDCDGRGEDEEGNECNKCWGGGELQCGECHNGSEECQECYGSGDIECHNCEGEERISNPNKTLVNVTACVSFDRNLNRNLNNYLGKVVPKELYDKAIKKSFYSNSLNVSVELNGKLDSLPLNEQILIGLDNDAHEILSILTVKKDYYGEDEFIELARDYLKVLFNN